MAEKKEENKEDKKTTQTPLSSEGEHEWTRHGMTKEEYEKLQGVEPEGEQQAAAGELLPAKREGSPFQVAELYGIPKWMVIEMGTPGNMHPFVTQEGLSIKTELKKPRAIQTHDVRPLADGYECTARIYPRLTKVELDIIKAASALAPEVQKMVLESIIVPYTAIGSATKKNCKNDRMWPYLLELAQTRAANRAKRQFTAMGLTSLEEMPEYEGEEAGDK